MATVLSSLIKGLFRLTCPPTAAGSWRNLSPSPRAHLEASILEGGPGLTKPQAQGASNPPFHVGWGAGGWAISDERGKMETPAPWLQREALLGWNPRGRLEMASPAEDSLQGWKGDKGRFWEPQKLPPVPAAQTVPRESKYLRSSHRLELEGEAAGGLSPCGHSSGERGLGGHPWQARGADPHLGTPWSSERWHPPTTSSPPARSLAETSREERQRWGYRGTEAAVLDLRKPS